MIPALQQNTFSHTHFHTNTQTHSLSHSAYQLIHHVGGARLKEESIGNVPQKDSVGGHPKHRMPALICGREIGRERERDVYQRDTSYIEKGWKRRGMRGREGSNV